MVRRLDAHRVEPDGRRKEEIATVGIHEHERDDARVERGCDHLDDRVEQFGEASARSAVWRAMARARVDATPGHGIATQKRAPCTEPSDRAAARPTCGRRAAA